MIRDWLLSHWLPHCHQCELQLKAFFVVLLTKTNNRPMPIIGLCRLSNGRYWLSANWPQRYRLSANNRCTSKLYTSVSRTCPKVSTLFSSFVFRCAAHSPFADTLRRKFPYRRHSIINIHNSSWLWVCILQAKFQHQQHSKSLHNATIQF